jgi:5-hydroxyisourate hydrolase
MSGITSHVLDTTLGKPAEGIEVTLEIACEDSGWAGIGKGTTNADGRVADLSEGETRPGHYRISFGVADYFERFKTDSFYPVVRIEFEISDPSQHFHVPLLLNPFGYSTYRGS